MYLLGTCIMAFPSTQVTALVVQSFLVEVVYAEIQ